MPNTTANPSTLQRSVAYIKALFDRVEAQQKNPDAPSRTDSKGRICPASIISPVDAARDDLVNDMVDTWKAEQTHLRDVKATGFANIEEFLLFSIATYGKKRSGEKNNVTLTNYAQTKKVTISYADRITFNEKLVEAQQHIENLIAEKSAGLDDVTKALLSNAFILSDGSIRVAEVLKLRRINIDHPEWEAAKKAIADAIMPMGAKGYVRVYERKDVNSDWVAISLDIAAL